MAINLFNSTSKIVGAAAIMATVLIPSISYAEGAFRYLESTNECYSPSSREYIVIRNYQTFNTIEDCQANIKKSTSVQELGPITPPNTDQPTEEKKEEPKKEDPKKDELLNVISAVFNGTSGTRNEEDNICITALNGGCFDPCISSIGGCFDPCFLFVNICNIPVGNINE